MFTLPTFSKLLVLAGLILLVWFLFRKGSGKKIKSRKHNSAKPVNKVRDMEPCPQCNSYVSAEAARHCGKDNCPY